MTKAIFYAASFANGPDDGIRLLDKVRFDQIRYLALSPDRKCLYAAFAAAPVCIAAPKN